MFAASPRRWPAIFFQQRGIIAQWKNAEGRIIVDQHPAIAIQHASARRNHRDGANLVALRPLRVFIGVDDLQLPEADKQYAHHPRDHVGMASRCCDNRLSLRNQYDRQTRASLHSFCGPGRPVLGLFAARPDLWSRLPRVTNPITAWVSNPEKISKSCEKK